MSIHRKKIGRVFELCENTQKLPVDNRLGAVLPTLETKDGETIDFIAQLQHCSERLHRLAWYTEALSDRRLSFEMMLGSQRHALEQQINIIRRDDLDATQQLKTSKTETEVLALSRPEMDNAACRMELLENNLDLEQFARALLVHLSIQQQFLVLPIIPQVTPLNDATRDLLKQFTQSLPLSLTHLSQVLPANDELNKVRHNLDVLLLRLQKDEMNAIQAIKLIVPIWVKLTQLGSMHLDKTLDRIEHRLRVTRRVAIRLKEDQRGLKEAMV